MTKMEQAVVDACVTNCTLEIQRTLKRFSVSNPNAMDKVLIRHDVEQLMNKYLRWVELENAN